MPKTTTKKRNTKAKDRRRIVIARVPKPKPFDLSASLSPAEKDRQIVALQALLINEGWMLIEQTLGAQIAEIDVQIVKKRSLDGAALEDKDCDRLRDLRDAMEEVKEKPRKLLAAFTREDAEEPNDDPYDR